MIGTSVPVNIAGTNLTGATVNAPAGISVTRTVVDATATHINATFTIAATAALGAKNITVTTLGGPSGAVTFTITASPVLTGIAPSSGVIGTSQLVT